MKKYAIHYLLLILILFSFQTNKTFAALEIDVTEGNIKPLPIAISFVRDIQNKDEDLGINISKVIASDLAGSGLFYPINPKAFLEEIVAIHRNTCNQVANDNLIIHAAGLACYNSLLGPQVSGGL